MAEQQQAAWPFPSERKRAERVALQDLFGSSHLAIPDPVMDPETLVIRPAELGTPDASTTRARGFSAANCNVLALDLGTQCGWALHQRGGRVRSGSERFDPKTCGGNGRRWLVFREWLTALAREYGDIQAVYFEDVKAHGPGVQAAHVYGGFLAILEAWAASNNIPLQGVGVGTIKKHATGRGNAKKPDMIAAAQALGVRVVDDNQADAVALLAYALEKEA